jgi:hypothetical protein
VEQEYYQRAIDSGLEGQQVSKIFRRWKPVVRNFVLACLRSSQLDNELGATLNTSPNGSTQAYLRAIRTDSLSNASYEQTPGSDGQFNIFPDEAAGDVTYATPTANQQGWIVLGLQDYAGIPQGYDTVQMDLDDATGVRQEVYVRNKVAGADTGRMPIIEFISGPGTAYPGIGIDIDCDVFQTGITTAAWPIGFEVVVASDSSAGGVLSN